MTPIKSLAMIMRSLEKAFLCKPHFMIMTHSKWCPLLFTCVLWDEPAIYLGVRKWGCREVEGGGGLAKTEKQNHAQEKKEKKLVYKEAWKPLCKSHLSSGICITGMLEIGNAHFIQNPIRMKSVE